jgi:hypothetical protein
VAPSNSYPHILRGISVAAAAAAAAAAAGSGRFSKQHFTEDLEIYEAIAETGEIDILRPKRNALLGEAIECGDEGFIQFLKHVLQIQPVNRPLAHEVSVLRCAVLCYSKLLAASAHDADGGWLLASSRPLCAWADTTAYKH